MSTKNKTIKEQVADLEKILAWFESEDFELDQALEKYQDAKKVVQAIEERLTKVKNQLEEL